MTITRKELIEKYIEFFKSKNHKHIPSASLIPENDPTILFTTAGMHPLVPYLLGQNHPLGKRLCSVQKCIRTQDIDEVGDATHHTFFEMLGNWSLGDYFKEDAIKFSFEFLTKILKIPTEKLAVTCFAGDKDAEKDKESSKIWLSHGIPKERIAFLPKKNNWWGPAGETGPCGPDTEMFYWKNNSQKPPKIFNPKDENWVEIWNDVFMEYNQIPYLQNTKISKPDYNKKGNLSPHQEEYILKEESGERKEKIFETKTFQLNELTKKNVDTGMGFERTLAVLNGFDDNYLTDIWQPIIKEIEKLSGKKYKGNEEAIRIIADHIRAAIFIIGDERGVAPSNSAQGYVVRRLIRRAIRYGKNLGIKENFTSKIAKVVIPIYSDYQELQRNHKFIVEELDKEEIKFNETLEKGLKKFSELSKKDLITGKDAFLLFQSFGFPIEMTQELAEEKGVEVDTDEYNIEFKKHQDLSRTSSAGQFKSGLADNSEMTKKLHTATHLLNEILRIVLKDENIKQKGSNITPERLRFDFSFPRKLTDEEIKQIEKLMNEKIKSKLKISKTEIPVEEALKTGAQAEFGTKYPELVSVYTINDPTEKRGWCSKEICTGPHVDNTSELGKFKIIKEESSSAGVRRIKAVLE